MLKWVVSVNLFSRLLGFAAVFYLYKSYDLKFLRYASMGEIAVGGELQNHFAPERASNNSKSTLVFGLPFLHLKLHGMDG